MKEKGDDDDDDHDDDDDDDDDVVVVVLGAKNKGETKKQVNKNKNIHTLAHLEPCQYKELALDFAHLDPNTGSKST